MIELTNKRTSYDVKNTSDDLVLNGNCLIGEGLITSFNGSFNNKDGMYIGSFYFSENTSGKINKNLTDIDSAISEVACKFIDETVEEIKKSI